MRRMLGHYAKFKIAKRVFDTGMRMYRSRSGQPAAATRGRARMRPSGRRIRT